MVDRNTVRQHGVIRMTDAVENMAGQKTGGEDSLTMALIDCMSLVVMGKEGI